MRRFDGENPYRSIRESMKSLQTSDISSRKKLDIIQNDSR